MKNKNILLSALLIAFTFSLSLNLNAQPGTTAGSDEDFFGDKPQDVPVDNNILWLAAAGAAYGLTKVVSKQKKSI
jgi:hypothetical protein